MSAFVRNGRTLRGDPPPLPKIITGQVVVNGFKVAISVIPPGIDPPAPRESPGRNLVVIPASDGHFIALEETGPTADQVASWERFEAYTGVRVDRVTGECILPKGGPR